MSYYLMHRGWMEHHLFKGQPYSDREAWLYLIENANYTPTKYRQANHLYDIPRGDIAASYRSLADKWKWSPNKAVRFVQLLKNDGMISIKTEHNFLQISICNYEAYQNPHQEDGTATEQRRNSDGTRTDTETDTNVKKTKKSKKVKESNTREDFLIPDWIEKSVWKAFMEVRVQKKAVQSDFALGCIIKTLDRYRQQGHDPNALIETAVKNSWKDIFEPKENRYANSPASQSKPTWADAANDYIASHSGG